jgi:AsmA protein
VDSACRRLVRLIIENRAPNTESGFRYNPTPPEVGEASHMNRIIKGIAIGAAVLVLLVLAASLLLTLLVDEKELKTTLLTRVNSRLNGNLDINGDLKVSLWPSVAVTAQDLHLQTPRGAAQDIASARAIRIGVALLPLLRQQVRANELVLQGLSVNAERDAAGKGNWEALLASVGEQTKVDEGENSPVDGGDTVAQGSPLFLHVDEVRIEDASLSLRDRAADTHYQLDKIDVRSQGVSNHGQCRCPVRRTATADRS